jgi:hypothetical protein
MPTFVALFRGPTVSEARLLALSLDADLTAAVAERLLSEPSTADPDDIVLREQQRSERRILRLVRSEALAQQLRLGRDGG